MGSVDDPDDVTVSEDEPARPATVLGWQPPTSPTGEGQHPSAPERPSRKPIVELDVGQRIGDRYVVRKLLGRGGMGAVYAALDEKLGEEVALKVVGDDLAGQLRDEVRLAQKVAHPNVCRTYDLEEVGGQYFVKMELLAGDTLAQRLKVAKKLPIDDAVRVARAVGAGLAAAHERGIIHRDLKPSNVMLVGERVVLMDFGIAKSVMSTMRTMAGTFGYMAPEQFANTRVDRRADLYALGCLLYEMLTGELVFGAANAVELAARHVMVAAPDVRGKRPDTPRWLAQAVAALLAKDPAARDAGWARLQAGPRSLRRFVLPAAALAIAGAGGAMLFLSLRTRPVPPCRGVEHRLAGVWDDAAKKQVEAAFDATKKPYAAKSFAAVAGALDAYTRDWTAAVTESCEATRVRGDQTEDVMALREDCFARDLEEVRALVQVLAAADAELVAKGDDVTAGLEPIPRCANIALLRAPDRPPTEPKDKVADLEHALADAQAQVLAGHALQALNSATRAGRVADELKYLPSKADALRIQGVALALAGNGVEAAARCTEAVRQGVLGHRDDVVVEAATCAAASTASLNLGEAKVWITLAHTFGDRVGVDAMREARMLDAEQTIAMQSGDRDAALAMQEKALAVAEHAHRADHIMLSSREESLGESLAKAGAYAKAAPHFESALSHLEAAYSGIDHPLAASMLTNMGACYAHMGEAGKAKAAYERALEILARTEGDASPNLVITLNNMADAATKANDPAGALVYLDRAKKVVDGSLGEANPLSHAVYTTRAEALAAAGRIVDARPQYDQAIELEAKYHSPYLAQTLTSRAQLELGAKKWADAATFEQRAIAAAEESGGAESPDLWQPLAGLARADIELGKKQDAKPLLARAIAVAEKAQVATDDLAPVRALLAKLR